MATGDCADNPDSTKNARPSSLTVGRRPCPLSILALQRSRGWMELQTRFFCMKKNESSVNYGCKWIVSQGKTNVLLRNLLKFP